MNSAEIIKNCLGSGFQFLSGIVRDTRTEICYYKWNVIRQDRYSERGNIWMVLSGSIWSPTFGRWYPSLKWKNLKKYYVVRKSVEKRLDLPPESRIMPKCESKNILWRCCAKSNGSVSMPHGKLWNMHKCSFNFKFTNFSIQKKDKWFEAKPLMRNQTLGGGKLYRGLERRPCLWVRLRWTPLQKNFVILSAWRAKRAPK